jgi:hypothetical protein
MSWQSLGSISDGEGTALLAMARWKDRAVLSKELKEETDGRKTYWQDKRGIGPVVRERNDLARARTRRLDTEQSLDEVNERLDDDRGSDGGEEEDVHLDKLFLHTTLPSGTPIPACLKARK